MIMNIDVWKIFIGDWGVTPEAMHVLSTSERERAAEFRHEADRVRFCCRHSALRHILGRAMGVAPEKLRFIREPGGRPRLVLQEGIPDIRFSLASRHELALVAVTEGVDIGVDIEHLRIPQNYLDIAHNYFTDGEYSRLLACPESERSRFFCECWTAREAVAKARGTGLDSLRKAVLGPVSRIDVGDDYAAALALDSSLAPSLEPTVLCRRYTPGLPQGTRLRPHVATAGKLGAPKGDRGQAAPPATAFCSSTWKPLMSSSVGFPEPGSGCRPSRP
jgi:phosphopantetheinyl transferase